MGDGWAFGLATPAGNGASLFTATLRRSPEDFRVEERLSFRPDGRGEHLWLYLEKRLLNTFDVVTLLAEVYGVGSADIGVSGLKDRRAVTRQWFSVRTSKGVAPLETALAGGAAQALGRVAPTAARPRPAVAEHAGEREHGGYDAAESRRADVGATETSERAALGIVEALRHARKLRRGTHVANRFRITLRDLVPSVALVSSAGRERPTSEPAATAFARRVDERLERLRAGGFPNYIGPQRFGRGGRNVERARAWFRNPKRPTTRLQRGLWLSVARSALFNRVCAARVEDGSWRTLLPGEPVMLDGTRGYFVPDDGAGRAEARELQARLERGDVHPSGPWWGRGETLAGENCRSVEERALLGGEDLRVGLERAGLAQERRALRGLPRELSVERPEPGALSLAFELPPGVFATTLLAELGDCHVAGG